MIGHQIIGITSDMLSAGMDEFCEFDPEAGEPISDMLSRLYRAMRRLELPCSDLVNDLTDNVSQPEKR